MIDSGRSGQTTSPVIHHYGNDTPSRAAVGVLSLDILTRERCDVKHFWGPPWPPQPHRALLDWNGFILDANAEFLEHMPRMGLGFSSVD